MTTETLIVRLTKLYAQLGTTTKNYDAEAVAEAIDALRSTPPQEGGIERRALSAALDLARQDGETEYNWRLRIVRAAITAMPQSDEVTRLRDALEIARPHVVNASLGIALEQDEALATLKEIDAALRARANSTSGGESNAAL